MLKRMYALIFEPKSIYQLSDMLFIAPHTLFGIPNVMRNAWLKF